MPGASAVAQLTLRNATQLLLANSRDFNRVIGLAGKGLRGAPRRTTGLLLYQNSKITPDGKPRHVCATQVTSFNAFYLVPLSPFLLSPGIEFEPAAY